MSYIFNLVLGCWVMDDDGTRILKDSTYSLPRLVKHWNESQKDKIKWDDVHYPCRIEHFELYETIPEVLGDCNDK